MKDKITILDLTLEEIREVFDEMVLDKFRAAQVWQWIYEKGAQSFGDMTNLAKDLRYRLESKFAIEYIQLEKRQASRDGTEKFLFKLADGNFIESVLIPSGKRQTQCISSQVGCRFGCLFCASGKGGFVRNLTAGEITGQVLYVTHRLGTKPTNVVLMGMGEPLDNYDSVETAIHILNSSTGLNIGARKITISTCGIIPAIKRLEKIGIQIELSISLHAPNDELRAKLMPINKKYPIVKLIQACREYAENTKRLVTFEYLMLSGINDSIEQAEELAALLRGFMSKVNIITMNPVGSGLYESSNPRRVKEFCDMIVKRGVPATIRKSRGADILAACGQLRLCEIKTS
jgi:23S rRNA (adenine2503-C2)-methyltransferase